MSKSFTRRGDSTKWAREVEHQAERGELRDARAVAELCGTTLADVLRRYRDEVTAHKKCAETER
jgi:hypothetical protein